MKKMEKISKILSIALVVMMIVSFCAPAVFAVDTKFQPDGWDSVTASGIKDDDVKSFSASLINIIAIVGSAAAIITLIILGVKYMMGSAEEKAEYKKTLLPYVIGAAMVFGASVLTGVIYNIMNP